MKRKQRCQWLKAILVLFVLSACQAHTPPPVSHDGLLFVPKSKFGEVYRDSEAQFNQYEAVLVDGCSVSFRANWLRDQNSSRSNVSNRITEEDVIRIKDKMSEYCVSHFRKSLTGVANLELVDDLSDTDKATLVLRPSIIQLDITAPDIMSIGRSRTYTVSAGEMTLSLEVYDGVTNAILARIMDRQKDPGRVQMQWANSVTNKAAANRIFRHWGKMLRESFSNVRTLDPAQH